MRERIATGHPWRECVIGEELPDVTARGAMWITVRRRWPPDACARKVSVPEWSDSMLRHAVVGGIECSEIGDAITELPKTADVFLHDVPVGRVVEAGHVADEVCARAQKPDQLARFDEHVALVVCAETLAGTGPRRTRRIRDQEANPRAPSEPDHPHEIADIHTNRAMAEVSLVAFAVVRLVVDGHIELDPGATESFGHAAGAREEL